MCRSKKRTANDLQIHNIPKHEDNVVEKMEECKHNCAEKIVLSNMIPKQR